ncbi:hypothetical protein D3C78_882300 [compost metagenome]
MRAGKQGNIAILNGQIFDRINDFAPVRQNHFLTGGREHQRVREVVDIFGCTCEVDKFRHGMQRRNAFHFLFQEIFNRFHVVVGGAFDRFDTCSIFFIEFCHDVIEVIVCLGSKSRNFLDCCVRGQFLQPAYFNLYTEFQQTIFAENPAQRADFIAVTSINRGNGGQ